MCYFVRIRRIIITPTGLDGGYWSIRRAIEVIEKNKIYTVTVLCEPQMGKHGLYPTLSTKNSTKKARLMLDLISMCDGKNSLLEIAEYLKTPIWELYETVEKLVHYELLQVNQ